MSNKSCCCCIFVKSNGLSDKYANLDWNTFQSNIGYLQHKMMYNKLFFLDRSFQLTNWPKKKKCYFLFQRKSICFKYFPSYTRWKRKGQFPDFRISSSHFHQKSSPPSSNLLPDQAFPILLIFVSNRFLAPIYFSASLHVLSANFCRGLLWSTDTHTAHLRETDATLFIVCLKCSAFSSHNLLLSFS